jgi:hypothetical protein
MTMIPERYADLIAGVNSCLDRLIFSGTLPGVCFAEGISSYLYSHDILLKDYPRFAEPFTLRVRQHIKQIAEDSGIKITYVQSPKNFRKETYVQKVLQERGDAPGIVCILSAMETCRTYKYRHSPDTGRNWLQSCDGKCVHYYIYLMHKEFGLCYLRVPTWLPTTLQFYCNGHGWLANQLRAQNIAFTMLDNAFVQIADWQKAQQLADAFPIERLHRELDELVGKYCPSMREFHDSYHWSITQAEYATDIVFKSQADLEPLYENLVYTALHTVKPDMVATFLGKKLTGSFEQEAGNDFQTRKEGTRIKHRFGPASIKMYDKHGIVLRIETTINDVSFINHYRTVEHRDGTVEQKNAPMKKGIYSLPVLQAFCQAANRRYIEFLWQLDDPTPGLKKVEKISEPVEHNERSYRGFNLFSSDDLDMLIAIVRGEFAMTGLRNAWLRKVIPHLTGPQVSRLLKRLFLHGLIKKAGRTYKYHLTTLGKQVCASALKLRQLVVIPSLATPLPT